MLPNEVTTQPDSIEKYFCIPFEKIQRVPMNEEDTTLLMQLLMAKKGITMPENKKPFLMQVIEKRIKHCFQYKIEDMRLLMFLMVITVSPGTAVMYLTYLQYWCKKHNCKELDLEKLCDIFPMGFPEESELKKIWDGQKVIRDKQKGGSDNLLDYAAAMKSIHFNN